MQTLLQIYTQTINTLKQAHIEEYEQETVIIFSELLNLNRLDLKLNENLQLTQEKINKIENIVLQRLNRKPLQYILKKAWFYGHEFYIQEGVFIPRPETEILVDIVGQLIKKISSPLKIADIGCGSGCIALSLAKIFSDIKIYAVDINELAINTAKINAKNLNIPDEQICFLHGDKFDPLKNKGRFDIIISNPPYIPSNIIKTLDMEVQSYEPLNALDGGNDGIDFYKDFANESPNFLNVNGYLCVETGEKQSDKIQNIFKKNNLKIESIIKDLNGINRVIVASFTGHKN